jgi:peptidyl-prolyl cis-trans isomerase C/peptidyl-prolyl cis-trans isomerase D
MQYILASFLGIFLVVGTAWAAVESPVVATVGDKVITLDEFNKRYDQVTKRAMNPPPKRPFLEDLVRYELGVQEAQKRQLQNDPIIAERIREQLYTGLIEKDLGEKIAAIKIDEDEMRNYYKSNPEVKTAHILIEIKAGATAEERAVAKKRAEEINSEVHTSKRSFADLAKLYSDDLVTKNTGGETGYQTRLSVMPSYYETAIHLKPGQISNVVETPFGFHIIKLLDVHSYSAANKKVLRETVFEKKKVDLFNAYFAKLKKNYKISVNDDALK